MIHLSVCTPTSGLLRAEYALSLAQFAMTFMTEAADPEEPRQHIVLRQYQSSSISNGREYLVRTSLDEGATHVLFIDDDMSFAPGVPIMLLRRNLPLVGCNYPIRFEGMPFSAFAPDFQTRVTTRADSPDLEEGGAVGLLEDLIVAVDFRNQGIGAKLLGEAVKWAESHGLKRLQLLADKNNRPALSFYQQQGWQSTQLICLRKC
jgi:GNAT superfamily N-acetyltransferase